MVPLLSAVEPAHRTHASVQRGDAERGSQAVGVSEQGAMDVDEIAIGATDHHEPDPRAPSGAGEGAQRASVPHGAQAPSRMCAIAGRGLGDVQQPIHRDRP